MIFTVVEATLHVKFASYEVEADSLAAAVLAVKSGEVDPNLEWDDNETFGASGYGDSEESARDSLDQ